MLEDTRERIRSILTSLIRVEYLRKPIFPDGIPNRFHAKSGIQRRRQSPRQYATAVPVKNRRQVNEASFQTDVCDIRAPNLVHSIYLDSAKKIGVLRVLLVRKGQVLFGVNSMDAELFHQMLYKLAAYSFSVVVVKSCPHSPLATSRIFCVKRIDIVQHILFPLRKNSLVVEAIAAYTHYGTLVDDRHPGGF